MSSRWKESFKTLWTIRHDDALMLRWAAPGLVRHLVQKIPHEKSTGDYARLGHVGLGPRVLPATRIAAALEVDKHWLHFLLWGRLGYDPTLGDLLLAARGHAALSRSRWREAARRVAGWSMVYPLVTGFHWADFDFQWYIEGCRRRPGPASTASGFHSVEMFITQQVHPGTDNIPIPKYVAGVLGPTPFRRERPR